MSVARDILRSYRAPGEVIAGHLRAPRREERALAMLIVACALIFVAQWPRLAREAATTDMPFEVLFGGALMAWIFIAPLLLYGLAALSHLLARAFGGQGDWVGARLALFWALLATAPLWLLWGLVAGFIGPGTIRDVAGLALLSAFAAIWGTGLAAAERPGLRA